MHNRLIVFDCVPWPAPRQKLQPLSLSAFVAKPIYRALATKGTLSVRFSSATSI